MTMTMPLLLVVVVVLAVVVVMMLIIVVARLRWKHAGQRRKTDTAGRQCTHEETTEARQQRRTTIVHTHPLHTYIHSYRNVCVCMYCPYLFVLL